MGNTFAGNVQLEMPQQCFKQGGNDKAPGSNLDDKCADPVNSAILPFLGSPYSQHCGIKHCLGSRGGVKMPPKGGRRRHAGRSNADGPEPSRRHMVAEADRTPEADLESNRIESDTETETQCAAEDFEIHGSAIGIEVLTGFFTVMEPICRDIWMRLELRRHLQLSDSRML